MRVAFNARLLHGQSLRGWNRYTVNLLAELPAIGVEPLLYTDRPLHPDHQLRLPPEKFPVRLSPPMRYFTWEQHWLPQQCARDGVDLLHCPLNFGLPRRCPCPRVLTLHDAIDQVYGGSKVSLRKKLKPASLRSAYSHWIARRCAERIITVSEHAKGDLVRHVHLPADKISVTYEAADEIFHKPVTDEDRRRAATNYGLPPRYVFYIGGWEKRKNITFLLKAFAAAKLDQLHLVLAGGKDEQKAELRAMAQSLGITDRLKLLGWVDDADLPAIYSGALCFVYPSEYEGFGLQLCEAMAVGCPVLAADATSLPEVLGDGGELFPLANPTKLSGLLQRLYREPDFHALLKERAGVRNVFFSWARLAAKTFAVYQGLAHP